MVVMQMIHLITIPMSWNLYPYDCIFSVHYCPQSKCICCRPHFSLWLKIFWWVKDNTTSALCSCSWLYMYKCVRRVTAETTSFCYELACKGNKAQHSKMIYAVLWAWSLHSLIKWIFYIIYAVFRKYNPAIIAYCTIFLSKNSTG